MSSIVVFKSVVVFELEVKDVGKGGEYVMVFSEV